MQRQGRGAYSSPTVAWCLDSRPTYARLAVSAAAVPLAPRPRHSAAGPVGDRRRSYAPASHSSALAACRRLASSLHFRCNDARGERRKACTGRVGKGTDGSALGDTDALVHRERPEAPASWSCAAEGPRTAPSSSVLCANICAHTSTLSDTASGGWKARRTGKAASKAREQPG